MDVDEVVATYGAAWNEPDAATRGSMLERSWADDGVYQDPMSRAEGRAALIAHIGDFQQNMPGMSIEATSGVDSYGRVVRFSWEMRDASGNVTIEGMDFGEIAADGRLATITGFFGPFPPVT